MEKREQVMELIAETVDETFTRGDAQRLADDIIALLFADSRTETQLGVETTYEGKTHVDTSFNGGFYKRADVFDAAKNGYRQYVETRPVERTVTTLYGPWIDMKEED